jgi:translation initiation factor 1
MAGLRLVYSTDTGRIAPRERASPGRGDRSGPPVPQAPDDGWVRIWRVKAGRGGKTATVVTGLPHDEAGLEALALELRRLVGAGGGVRQGAIELQGDHRARVQQRLTQLGYQVKLAGG